MRMQEFLKIIFVIAEEGNFRKLLYEFWAVSCLDKGLVYPSASSSHTTHVMYAIVGDRHIQGMQTRYVANG